MPENGGLGADLHMRIGSGEPGKQAKPPVVAIHGRAVMPAVAADFCAVSGLLQHMCQLVRQQMPALGAAGRVFAAVEDDVVPEGEGARADGAGRRCRLRAIMDTHRFQRMAKSWLDEAAGGMVKWLARRGEARLKQGACCGGGARAGERCQLQPLL